MEEPKEEVKDRKKDLDLYFRTKIGTLAVDDALINLSNYKQVNANYGNKAFILNAIYHHNYDTLREISKYFYEASGIYYRLCRYLAYLYRYDWYVTPIVINDQVDSKKVTNDFYKVLNYFDNSGVKRMSGDIALEIMINGVFYGFIVDTQKDGFKIQKLPANYCRCRFYSGDDPIVELNLRFFDDFFPNAQYKLMILKMFPKDIQKAYVNYKQGKIKPDYPGDERCWYPLDPGMSVKLSINDNEFPPFVGIIPSLIDLDQAQELDRRKTMQELLKIMIQKMPINKDGDLIFDVDEARDLHDWAVAIMRKAVGVEVFTTFADVSMEDLRDKNSTTSTDDLEKVERTVYNNSGVTKNLFNADGNLAVTNSILTDEASIRDFLLQLIRFFNKIASKFNKKNYSFKFGMLETTQFNYKDLSKLYREQASLGYGKIFPQLALGHSQSSILATFKFENDILHLADSMIPPYSSNTLSKNMIGNNNSSSGTGEAGRPEKEDSEKSDKTLANKESTT